MDAIEKRARELLAKVHADSGWTGLANEIRLNATFDIDHGLALAAIRAALTPPEGYALASAARDALPFVAYAFDQGIDGAEEVGRAIEEALRGNQPERYVLVSQTQLSRLLRDVVTAADFVGGRGQSKPLARRLADQAWALIESPGDAARPEVPGA